MADDQAKGIAPTPTPHPSWCLLAELVPAGPWQFDRGQWQRPFRSGDGRGGRAIWWRLGPLLTEEALGA